MESEITGWLSVVFRFVHVLAAIMWIGHHRVIDKNRGSVKWTDPNSMHLNVMERMDDLRKVTRPSLPMDFDDYYSRSKHGE
jgi:uncharacterized membrane protein